MTGGTPTIPVAEYRRMMAGKGMDMPVRLACEVAPVPTPQAVLLPAPPLVLALPWPPSGNRYWRHVVVNGQARVLLSKEARAYRAHVAGLVLTARRSFGADRLAIVSTYHAPDSRARDLDNVWKQLGDALQAAGLFADDAQIDRLTLVRGALVRPRGKVVVEVRQV